MTPHPLLEETKARARLLDLKHHEALGHLESGTCHCGQPKDKGYWFCRGCWCELPCKLKDKLLQRGQRLSNAYELACKWLDTGGE